MNEKEEREFIRARVLAYSQSQKKNSLEAVCNPNSNVCKESAGHCTPNTENRKTGPGGFEPPTYTLGECRLRLR